MKSGLLFEQSVQEINQREVTVLRNVHHFPVYGKDIISPTMMVCINHSGTARALYDLQEVLFTPNELALLLPNHIVHPIESSADYCATIIIHSAPFVDELTSNRITYNRNKFHLHPACRLNEEEMREFMKAVDMMEIISSASTIQFPHRHEMLMSQVSIMAEMLDSYRRSIDDKEDATKHGNLVFNKFCGLLVKHYRSEHEVPFYADQLHLSSRYFSSLIKDAIGMSASDYIEQYIATQARNLLSSRPDLSVQQIGFYLGYVESSSFCRFFKRRTGMTAIEFRRSKN